MSVVLGVCVHSALTKLPCHWLPVAPRGDHHFQGFCHMLVVIVVPIITCIACFLKMVSQKNAFEWAARQKIPHTEDAIMVTQHAANFLVR